MHNDLKKDKKPAVKQGWTIKGIEMETRLSLQKAAKKEGKKLGQYCNLKLREAAHNTLKANNNIVIHSEDVRDEIKIRIDDLRNELPNIVKAAIKEANIDKKGLFKKIFG